MPYLDTPFQHASPKILRAIKRPGGTEKMLERIGKWRTVCPDLTLRSTFIAGFPGETEEDFKLLLDWLQEARIDRADAFKYEPITGAAANDLGLSPVAPEVCEIRYKRFREHCQKISARKLKEKIGKRLAVIVDHGETRSGVAARRAMRPKSTARFISSRGALCGRAPSSP